MSCIITSGYTNQCKASMGGIAAFYIANFEHVDAIEDATGTDGLIDTITMTATNTFYKIDFGVDTASFNQENAGPAQNGYWSQTVALSITGNNAVASKLANELKLGKFIVIVEDRSGNRQVFGRQYGMTVPTGGIVNNSGAALEDVASFNVTLTGGELEPAPFLDGTVVIPV